MNNKLEVDSVIKSFNGRQILTDVYLICVTGDIIGLLGRNGSGKSTLLKILFGVMESDSKFIRSNGKIQNQAYRIPNSISYLPQESFLPNRFSVSKIIGIWIKEDNLANIYNDAIINRILGSKVSELSGGELRYLEILLVLNQETKFALLDEPFNGLAPVTIDLIKQLIVEKSKTKGIILTDHSYRNVLDVANKFLLVYDGGIKEVNGQNDLMRWGYLNS